MYEMTASANCTEGLFDSEYYDFYAAYGYNLGETTEEPETIEPETIEPTTFAIEIVMIAEGQSCNSENTSIDNFSDINDCAQAVVDYGYQFFSYDPNDGECRYEVTS